MPPFLTWCNLGTDEDGDWILTDRYDRFWGRVVRGELASRPDRFKAQYRLPNGEYGFSHLKNAHEGRNYVQAVITERWPDPVQWNATTEDGQWLPLWVYAPGYLKMIEILPEDRPRVMHLIEFSFSLGHYVLKEGCSAEEVRDKLRY